MDGGGRGGGRLLQSLAGCGPNVTTVLPVAHGMSPDGFENEGVTVLPTTEIELRRCGR